MPSPISRSFSFIWKCAQKIPFVKDITEIVSSLFHKTFENADATQKKITEFSSDKKITVGKIQTISPLQDPKFKELSLEKRLEVIQERFKNSKKGGFNDNFERDLRDNFNNIGFAEEFKKCTSQEERLILAKKIVAVDDFFLVGLSRMSKSLLACFEEFGLKELEFGERLALIAVITSKDPKSYLVRDFFSKLGFVEDFQNATPAERLVLANQMIQAGNFGSQELAVHFGTLKLNEIELEDRLLLIKTIIQTGGENEEANLLSNFNVLGLIESLQVCKKPEKKLALIYQIIQLGSRDLAGPNLVKNLNDSTLEGILLENRMELIRKLAKTPSGKEAVCDHLYKILFAEDFKNHNFSKERLELVVQIVELGDAAAAGLAKHFKTFKLDALDLSERFEFIKVIAKEEAGKIFLSDHFNNLGLIEEFQSLNSQEKLALAHQIIGLGDFAAAGLAKHFDECGLDALDPSERLPLIAIIAKEGLGNDSLYEHFNKLGFSKDFKERLADARFALANQMINLGRFAIKRLPEFFDEFKLKELELEKRLELIEKIAQVEEGNLSLFAHFEKLGVIEEFANFKFLEHTGTSLEEKMTLANRMIGLGDFAAKGLAKYFDDCGFKTLKLSERLAFIKTIAQKKTALHELIEHSQKLGFIEDFDKYKTPEEKISLVDQILQLGAFGAAILAKNFNKIDWSGVSSEEQLKLIQKIALAKKETFLQLENTDELDFFNNIQICKTSASVKVPVEIDLLMQLIHKMYRDGDLKLVYSKELKGQVARQSLLEKSYNSEGLLIYSPSDKGEIFSILTFLSYPTETFIQSFLECLKTTAKLSLFSGQFTREFNPLISAISSKAREEDREHLQNQLLQCCAYIAGVCYDLDEDRLKALDEKPQWIKALLQFPNPSLRYALARELSFLPSSTLEALEEENPIKIRSILLLSRLESLHIITFKEKEEYLKVAQNKIFKDTDRQIALYSFLLDIIHCNPLTDKQQILIRKMMEELFVKDANKETLLKTISQMESLHQIHSIFGKEAFFEALENKEEGISYETSFLSRFSELFSGLEQIQNLTERYKKTLGSFRDPADLFVYLSRVKQLPKEEQTRVLLALSQYVVSVLNGTFRELRYHKEGHAHLEKVFENLTIQEQWTSCEEKKPLKLEMNQNNAPPPEKKDLRKEFANRVAEGHLTAAGDYTIFKNYLKGGNFEISQIQTQIEAAQPDSEDLKRLQIQKDLIELCEGKKTITEFMKSRPVIDLGELEHDIKALQSTSRKEGELTIMETDDPDDLLHLGDVKNSCQRINGTPSLNKCLVGYLLNGEIKAIVVKNKAGQIIARSVIRLLCDSKGNPVLVQERLYNDLEDPKVSAAITNWAIQKAKIMQIPLVSNEVGSGPSYADKPRFLGGGLAPYIYSDATRSIQKGPFEISGCHYLYDPNSQT